MAADREGATAALRRRCAGARGDAQERSANSVQTISVVYDHLRILVEFVCFVPLRAPEQVFVQ